MRSPLLAISLAGLAIHAPLVAAQEAPRVLFCSGQCTAVDQKGVRTPAPKGTQLQPGQRLETGPGSYAQLKLGEGAVGVGEQAGLGLDGAGGADLPELHRLHLVPRLEETLQGGIYRVEGELLRVEWTLRDAIWHLLVNFSAHDIYVTALPPGECLHAAATHDAAPAGTRFESGGVMVILGPPHV